MTCETFTRSKYTIDNQPSYHRGYICMGLKFRVFRVRLFVFISSNVVIARCAIIVTHITRSVRMSHAHLSRHKVRQWKFRAMEMWSSFVILLVCERKLASRFDDHIDLIASNFPSARSKVQTISSYSLSIEATKQFQLIKLSARSTRVRAKEMEIKRLKLLH